MYKYVSTASNLDSSNEDLLKSAVNFYRRYYGGKITIKNGGIELFRDDDPADLAAYYDHVSSLYSEIDNLKAVGLSDTEITESLLSEFNFAESLYTARGWLTVSEFKRKRQQLRNKYLNENKHDSFYESACSIFQDIFESVFDTPFDPTVSVIKKAQKKYELQGFIRDNFVWGFTSCLELDSIFTEEELADIESFDNVRRTYTGLLELTNLGDEHDRRYARAATKRYNDKIKSYVSNLLSRFSSTEYTLTRVNGSGNIRLIFN